MTHRRPRTEDRLENIGLDEFEFASATSLAPFEEACAILLDEIPLERSGMLTEFEESLEIVLLHEEGAEEETQEPLGEPETEPAEGEEEAAAIPLTEEAVPEVGPIEVEPPPEVEAVPPKPERAREPAGPVIGFVCRHAVEISQIADLDGRMHNHPMVHLIELECAGMVKMSWLREVLDRGASGTFVVTCRPASCHHRTGAAILAERWEGRRRPMLLSRCDRRRLAVFPGHRMGVSDLLSEINSFVRRLGELDADAAGKEPSTKTPIEQVDMGDIPI